MASDEANDMTEFKGVVHVLEERTSVPPPLLYKYCAFNEWTPKIFQNNELYFRSPNDFNDPFDSIVRFTCQGSIQQRKKVFREFMPRHDPTLSRSQSLSLEKRFKDRHWDAAFVKGLTEHFLRIRGRIGVCCLTGTKDSILMWSHYASYHTGFCLEFQTDDPFFSKIRPVDYPNDYSATLPCVNVLMPRWNEVTGIHAEGLSTKAKEWDYEHEWRIIDLERSAGPRQFRSEILRGVILGCKIQDDDRKRMLEWCKGRLPRPTLYQARMKETEYGLDIEAIKY